MPVGFLKLYYAMQSFLWITLRERHFQGNVGRLKGQNGWEGLRLNRICTKKPNGNPAEGVF
jgi:hypothetical protein